MVGVVFSGSKSHVTSKNSAPKPVAAHKQQAADVGRDVSANPLWLVEWVSCSGGYAAVTKQ